MSTYQPSASFWKGRKILVTGGDGFIGSHLVEMLLDLGAEVRIVSIEEGAADRFLKPRLSELDVRVGDLRDETFTNTAVEKVDYVLHLAAVVGGIEYNIRHPASIFRDNIRLTLNVLEAARIRKIEKVLVTSSACVYPRHCTIPTPESEGFKDRPEPTNEGYGWAKRMSEFIAEAYVKEYGMQIRVARPYNAYGPRDNFDPRSSHVIPALIHRVEQGENPLVAWGDGTATRGFLYVKDFALGLLAVMERSPQVEAINIGPSEEVSIGQLARLIVDVAGRGTDIVFDDSRPTGQPRRCCDTDMAEQLLGFRATMPLEQGIRETIQWYRENPPTE